MTKLVLEIDMYYFPLKGKRAHTFIMSILMLISCLAVRTLVTKRNAKISIICIYKEKKIKFGKLWTPNQSLYYVIRGEFPRNEKGFLCVMSQRIFNEIT